MAMAMLLAGGCGSKDGERGTLEVDLLESLTRSTRTTGYVDPGNPQDRHRLGEGWHGPERSPSGKLYAWTRAETATLQVPFARTGPARLFVRGYGLDDGRGPRWLTVRVNGRNVGSRRIRKSHSTLEYDVPRSALRFPDNELELEVDRLVQASSRKLGFLVDYVLLRDDASTGGTPGDDPFDRADRPVLDDQRSVEFRSASLSTGHLDLEWVPDSEDGDSLVVEVLDESGAEELISRSFAAKDGAAGLELPSGLPYRSLLRMRLESADGDLPRGSVRLEQARLVMPAPAHDVILIVVDTLRPDYLSCYGGAQEAIETPAIDGLAVDGILFENAFSQTPITGPSHGSMLTSRYPSEVGVTNNNRGKVPQAVPFWPELLQRRGYHTSGVVSIGPIQGYMGFARGWQNYDDRMGLSWIVSGDVILERCLEALKSVHTPFFFWAHFSDPHEPYDAHGLAHHEAHVTVGGKRVATVETTRYQTLPVDLELPDEEVEVVIEASHPFHVRRLAFAKEGPDTPRIDPPDPPSRPFEEYRARIGARGRRRGRLVVSLSDRADSLGEVRQRYGREVAYTDEQIGRLLEQIRAMGRYDESWIVFASDHGEGLGCHDHLGHVQNLYDCLTRVPLIIKPPRSSHLPTGVRRPDVAALTDVLPTVLSATGLPPLPSAAGRDLLAENADRFEGTVFMETHTPGAEKTKYAVRGSQRKIIWTPDGDVWEFYDLERDPEESNSLLTDRPQEAARWRSRLETLVAELYGPTADEEEPPLDTKTEEMLRSLGYLD